MKWSELRDELRKGEWYAVSVLCFLAGVIAGREMTLLAKPEPVLILIGIGVAMLVYSVTLLTATIASVREEA